MASSMPMSLQQRRQAPRSPRLRPPSSSPAGKALGSSPNAPLRPSFQSVPRPELALGSGRGQRPPVGGDRTSLQRSGRQVYRGRARRQRGPEARPERKVAPAPRLPAAAVSVATAALAMEDAPGVRGHLRGNGNFPRYGSSNGPLPPHCVAEPPALGGRGRAAVPSSEQRRWRGLGRWPSRHARPPGLPRPPRRPAYLPRGS